MPSLKAEIGTEKFPPFSGTSRRSLRALLGVSEADGFGAGQKRD